MTIADNLIPVSFNGFSTDLQVQDALNFLEYEYPDVWEKLTEEYPKITNLQFEGSWFDTEAMNVDIEWSSWLADSIEATGLIFWEEGEPWGFLNESLSIEGPF